MEVVIEVLVLYLVLLGGEGGCLILIEKFYDIFEFGIEVVIEFYEVSGDEKYFEKVFILVEWGKVMMLKVDDSVVDILN